MRKLQFLLKKVTPPLFPSISPLKVEVLSSSPFLKIWLEANLPPPCRKGGYPLCQAVYNFLKLEIWTHSEQPQWSTRTKHLKASTIQTPFSLKIVCCAPSSSFYCIFSVFFNDNKYVCQILPLFSQLMTQHLQNSADSWKILIPDNTKSMLLTVQHFNLIMLFQCGILIFPKKWITKFKLHRINASVVVSSWIKWQIDLKKNLKK